MSGGPDKLTSYTFNTKKFHHFFCSTCGTSVFAEADGIGRMLNVRTLDDFDMEKVTVNSTYDGKSI